jgi:hypothetical protein
MDKETSNFATTIILYLVVMGVIILIGIKISETEAVVIEDELVNVSTILEDDGQRIKYIVLQFNDGSEYKVKPYMELDLTVNSKLILQLYRHTYIETDIWYVDRVVKVPNTL